MIIYLYLFPYQLQSLALPVSNRADGLQHAIDLVATHGHPHRAYI